MGPAWVFVLVAGSRRWRNALGKDVDMPERSRDRSLRIWIHASSVGEVRASARLVEELSRQYGAEIVFSTATNAGQAVAKSELRAPVYFFYLPLDVPWIQRKIIERVRADVLLLIETEVWPSLILEAKSANMRVAIGNARMSRRGFNGYRRFKSIISPVLRMLDGVVAQSELNARRYRELGAPPQKIRVGGNTKQDSVVSSPGKIDLRRRAGWSSAELVLVGGSTRPGEEKIICEAFVGARASSPNLRLVLAPRHLKRAAKVASIASSFGLKVTRWSELKRSGQEVTPTEIAAREISMPSEKVDAVVLDTIGELVSAYCEADVAFIGGTLSGNGGHNILEPAAAGIPIIAGPSRENIEEEASSLLKKGALIAVSGVREFSLVLSGLAGSPGERARRGELARAFYTSRPVASLVTLDCLKELGVL